MLKIRNIQVPEAIQYLAMVFVLAALAMVLFLAVVSIPGCAPSASTKITPAEAVIKRDLDDRRPIRDRTVTRTITIYPKTVPVEPTVPCKE